MSLEHEVIKVAQSLLSDEDQVTPQLIENTIQQVLLLKKSWGENLDHDYTLMRC